MEYATISYYVQIRLVGESEYDSERDWLHDDSPIAAEFDTLDEAKSAIEPILIHYLQEVEEEPVTYTITKTYPDEHGGGFWFKTPDGREGRALIRRIIKKVEGSK